MLNFGVFIEENRVWKWFVRMACSNGLAWFGMVRSNDSMVKKTYCCEDWMNNATEDGKAMRMNCEKVNIRIGLQSRGNVYKENTKHDKHRKIMYTEWPEKWKRKVHICTVRKENSFRITYSKVQKSQHTKHRLPLIVPHSLILFSTRLCTFFLLPWFSLTMN